MDYEVRKVLDSDQISAIVETLKDVEPTYYHQDYNLHDVKKWSHGINSDNIPQLKVVRDLFPDLAVHSQYFLEYGVDSFTKQHTDNDALIVKTVVTLIQSTDLVGGETIVLKTYHRKPRPSVAERKGAAQYGKRIIPDVVYMEDGEAIIYDRSLPHSVSQVKQGTRLVLVTWFMNKDK